MDGKLALLYFIIVAMITLSYLNDEKVDRMKHAITAVMRRPNKFFGRTHKRTKNNFGRLHFLPAAHFFSRLPSVNAKGNNIFDWVVSVSKTEVTTCNAAYLLLSSPPFTPDQRCIQKGGRP